MKIGILLITLTSILFLSGCLGLPTKEERLSIWKEKCVGYGHDVGSSSMATCMGEEERAYRAR